MAMYFYLLFNECLVQDGGQKSGRNVTKRDEIAPRNLDVTPPPRAWSSEGGIRRNFYSGR